MKPLQRCGKTFFPQSTLLVQLVNFLGYFRPLREDVIYQVTEKDFTSHNVRAINIETAEPVDVHFNTPVTPLKTF